MSQTPPEIGSGPSPGPETPPTGRRRARRRFSRRTVVAIVVLALAAGAGTATWVRSVQTARAAEQAQAQADARAAEEAARAAKELRAEREARQARETREREAEAARLAEEQEREAAEQAAQEAAEKAAQEKAAEEAAAEKAAQEEAERAAEAEAAAAAGDPRLGGPPSSGAGPDCGGPESYQPPVNGRYTFYTSTPATTGDGTNGDIPRSQLAPLGWCQDSQGNKQWLVPDAVAALTALNAEFHEVFGENIAVDMSYRSLQTQVEMREAFGTIAATPGTSNHGWGTAFDTWEWDAYSFGTPRYEWLVANGPAYGWIAPDWARANGSNPEYWHFEYTG